MKDYEERQREYEARRRYVFRAKIIAGLVLAIVLVCIFFVVSALRSGYMLDPVMVMSVHYDGFDGAAGAELLVDREELYNCMDKAYAKYSVSLWPIIKNHTQTQFHELADSIEASLDNTQYLKNGDTINISVSYNQALAKELDVRIKYDSIEMTVSGLEEGTILEGDALFEDLTVSLNGISPAVSVNLINNSQDEFIKTISYRVESGREYFENGDSFTILAQADQETAREMHYNINPELLNFSKEYSVEGFEEYVSDTEEFSQEDFLYAVEKGKEYFTDANEYGLRIFTEAGLVYTWVGTSDYTFEWSNPRLISAYVETVKDEYKSDFSKKYNYLELVYEIHIEQANGTGCDAEAVVCFDSLTKNSDGSINLNEDSGQLFSASYLDKNIKSSLNSWFGSEYELKKFDLGKYDL